MSNAQENEGYCVIINIFPILSDNHTKNIDIVDLKNDLQPLHDKYSIVESDDFEMNYKHFDSIARQIVNKHVPMITRTTHLGWMQN